jgi:choline-sulfatase
VQKSQTAYYALVRMIDRLAGRVFDKVAERDDTVSIYTSDHGEALGERGLWWKSTFYDESAKVPLIISGGDFPAGAIDTRVASLMDLSQTLVSLSGATPMPGHIGRNLKDESDWEDRCFSSYYGGLMNIKTTAPRHRMVRIGHYKLCWYDGAKPQLFDLGVDPFELNDISSSQAELVVELAQQLLAGWKPAQIAIAQRVSHQRTATIREWVETTKPEEPWRWRDPQPDRNRYQ